MSVRWHWVVLWSLWAARLVPQPAPLLRLAQGALRGRLAYDGSHYQYLGIPYANSSLQYRFQAPGPGPRWPGVLEAADEHVRCAQAGVGREDCLVLNVFAPHGSGPHPVMVFIHGGGFYEGSGAPLLYGPHYLMARGVVLVTFNYRLGPLGFLCLRTAHAPGNAGLKDQVAALGWVRANIAAFGGDPDNVTIFGESAGGTSVSYHLLSPMSRGLFHRAIVQSGSSVAPWARQADPRGVAVALARALGHNSEDPEQLYNIFMNTSVSELVDAKIPRKQGQLKFMHLPYRPCTELQIEGVESFITDTPFNILSSGDFYKVPVIIGATDQEGYFFAAQEDDESLSSLEFKECFPDDLQFPNPEARHEAGEQLRSRYAARGVSRASLVALSRLHAEPHFALPVLHETALLQQGGATVYSYVFAHAGWRNLATLVLGPRFWRAGGATHADDLFYLFSQFYTPTLLETDMIYMMTTLWTNFAKYGAPGAAGDVHWPPATGAAASALWLSAKPRLAPLATGRSPHLHFWRELYRQYRAPPHST